MKKILFIIGVLVLLAISHMLVWGFGYNSGHSDAEILHYDIPPEGNDCNGRIYY